MKPTKQRSQSRWMGDEMAQSLVCAAFGIQAAWLAAATLTVSSASMGCLRTEKEALESSESRISLGGGGLWAGGEMYPGDVLTSAQGNLRLTYQSDGNIVLQAVTNQVLWDSGTAGAPSTKFAMQRDGNIVLYNGNAVVWSSGTGGQPDGAFVLRIDEHDARLRIYSPAAASVWFKPEVLPPSPQPQPIKTCVTQQCAITTARQVCPTPFYNPATKQYDDGQCYTAYDTRYVSSVTEPLRCPCVVQ